MLGLANPFKATEKMDLGKGEGFLDQFIFACNQTGSEQNSKEKKMDIYAPYMDLEKTCNSCQSEQEGTLEVFEYIVFMGEY